MSEQRSTATERLAKFHVLVHARNRNSDYGSPLTIIAATRQDAVNRAVELGWSGHPRDAVVTIQRVEDVDPRECPRAATPTKETP